MKKLLVLLLVLMMVFSTFTACGNNDDVQTGDDVQQDQLVDGEGEGEVEGDLDAEGDVEQDPAAGEEENNEESADKEEEKKPEADKNEDKKPEADKKPESDKKEESKPAASASNAVELLSKVWATYAEDEMFPAGYMDEEGNMIDGPAKIGTEDGETLDALLGVPANKAGSIDNASIMMHMMNSNTFTAGAFKVSNAKSLSDAIKGNLAGRQWMCGFPDTLLTIQVGDYLISAFGNAELIETFKTKVTATYSDAKVLCEEPLAF